MLKVKAVNHAHPSHQYRNEERSQKPWGITDLYNAYFHEPNRQLYKLHKQLRRPLQAYDFSLNAYQLEKLLALTLELAEKKKNGEPVIGPWDPTTP
jgi:hypothetical protein